MTAVLVECDGAVAPPRLTDHSWDFRFSLDPSSKQSSPNSLALCLDSLTHQVLKNPVSPRGEDLIRIAGFALAADQSVSRGGLARDVYAKNWKRAFTLVVPVNDLDCWTHGPVEKALCAALDFLTDDDWAFEFVPLTPDASQLVLSLGRAESLHNDPDSVLLLSGGADSLCAAVDLVAGPSHRRPLLVSHRPGPRLVHLQREVANGLKARFPDWAFPQISAWIHRRKASTWESTQRSRSFLFLATASAVANELGIRDVFLPDNGVVSLNVPKTPQLVGTMASRSTHPGFIRRFQALVDEVFGRGIAISNPLALKTRAETLRVLASFGCEELLEQAVSCAKARATTRAAPHCGVCSQCIDRRFGSIAAAMERYDPGTRYEVDIFREEIEEGAARIEAMSHVAFAARIAQLSADGLNQVFDENQELLQCIPIAPNMNEVQSATEIAALLCRHSSEVLKVMNEQLALASTDPKLAPHCLIRLVGEQKHFAPPQRCLLERFSDILSRAISMAYPAGRPPQDETDLQCKIDAVLEVERLRLEREFPLIPFASVSSIPDFAEGACSGAVLIEAKYAKTRQRTREIVSEISSRLVIWHARGFYTLFVVFDPLRMISDVDRFTNDLSSLSDHCRITVVR